jgi:hypothetical protein
MLLVLEIAAGIVLGALVLCFLEDHGRRLREEEIWRRMALAQDAKRHADTLAHYANSLRYWEKCERETPEGFDDGHGWVSSEYIASNIEFRRQGLKHIEAGSYQTWIADHAAATREKLFGGIQPDPTGRQRFNPIS